MKMVSNYQQKFFEYLIVISSLAVLWGYYLLAGNTQLIPYLVCAVYIYMGIVFWHNDFRAFMLIFPFYYVYLGVVLSSAYLEQGAYISEQEAFSFETGGTLRLLSYLVIFLGVAVSIFKQRKHHNSVGQHLVWDDNKFFGVRLVLILTFIVLLILFLGLLSYGSPVFMGITRFQYWEQHPLSILWKFQIQLSQLSFLLGAAYVLTTSVDVKRKIKVLFGAILLTNILYADKFSSNIMCIMNYTCAYLVMHMIVNRKKPKIIKILSVGFLLGLFFYNLIAWSYVSLHGIASSDVADYIVQRALALQGHTWWGIDSFMAQGGEPVGIEYLFSTNTAEHPGGLYLLMYAIAPATRVDWYLEHGVSFTMGGIALPIYTLGYLGAIPYVIIAGVLIGICARYIEDKLLKQQFFRTLIGVKIMWVFVMAFGMGNPYLLFGVGPMLYAFVVLFDKIVLRDRDLAIVGSPHSTISG